MILTYVSFSIPCIVVIRILSVNVLLFLSFQTIKQLFRASTHAPGPERPHGSGKNHRDQAKLLWLCVIECCTEQTMLVLDVILGISV